MKNQVNQDPVENILSLRGLDPATNPEYYEREYHKLTKEMNLDLPIFYFSLMDSTSKNVGKMGGVENSYNDLLNAIFPSFRLNGFKNQFHYWLNGFVRGKYGISIVDGQKVTKRFFSALKWTLAILIPNIMIAIPFSFLLGVLFFRKQKVGFIRFLESLATLVLSIPLFWLATMVMIFLCTSYYGLGLFNTAGIWNYENDSIWTNYHNLILPILIISVLDISYLSQVLKSSISEEFKKPYATSLQAKGLGQKLIFNKHLLKNSLTPIITLIAENLPKALGGTLIIEVVFNIPGMGRLMLESVLLQDFNMIILIITATAALTLVFYSLGDYFNYRLQPKSRFHA